MCTQTQLFLEPSTLGFCAVLGELPGAVRRGFGFSLCTDRMEPNILCRRGNEFPKMFSTSGSEFQLPKPLLIHNYLSALLKSSHFTHMAQCGFFHSTITWYQEFNGNHIFLFWTTRAQNIVCPAPLEKSSWLVWFKLHSFPNPIKKY